MRRPLDPSRNDPHPDVLAAMQQPTEHPPAPVLGTPEPDWNWLVSDHPDAVYRRAAVRAATAKWGRARCNDAYRKRCADRLFELRHFGVHASNLLDIAKGKIPWPGSY